MQTVRRERLPRIFVKASITERCVTAMKGKGFSDSRTAFGLAVIQIEKYIHGVSFALVEVGDAPPGSPGGGKGEGNRMI